MKENRYKLLSSEFKNQDQMKLNSNIKMPKFGHPVPKLGILPNFGKKLKIVILRKI